MLIKLLIIGNTGNILCYPGHNCLTVTATSHPRVHLSSFRTAEVGKTYLLNRFASVNKVTQFSPLSTIGIDFKIKHVTIDEVPVKLQVTRSFCNTIAHALLYFTLNLSSIDMGYSWSRTISNYHHILFPRRSRYFTCI